MLVNRSNVEKAAVMGVRSAGGRTSLERRISELSSIWCKSLEPPVEPVKPKYT